MITTPAAGFLAEIRSMEVISSSGRGFFQDNTVKCEVFPSPRPFPDDRVFQIGHRKINIEDTFVEIRENILGRAVFVMNPIGGHEWFFY